MTAAAQRVIGIAVLLVGGIFSLPLSAAVLDGDGSENWIMPVQFAAMAAIGALLAVAFPGLACAGAPTGVRAAAGAVWGVLAAVFGVLVFWLLLGPGG